MSDVWIVLVSEAGVARQTKLVFSGEEGARRAYDACRAAVSATSGPYVEIGDDYGTAAALRSQFISAVYLQHLPQVAEGTKQAAPFDAQTMEAA